MKESSQLNRYKAWAITAGLVAVVALSLAAFCFVQYSKQKATLASTSELAKRYRDSISETLNRLNEANAQCNAKEQELMKLEAEKRDLEKRLANP